MRKIPGIILVFAMLQVQGQKNDQHPLDSLVKDIIHTQLVNDLEYEVPFMFFTPGFFLAGSYTSVNNKIYFENQETTNRYFKDPRQIIADDLQQFIKFDVLTEDDLNHDLNIKSFSDHNLLFTLRYEQNKDIDNIVFNLPGGNYTREQKFNNGTLLSSKISKRNKQYLSKLEYENKDKINIIKYDVSKSKYTYVTKQYQDGKLFSVTHFKPNKERKPGKIKKIEKYHYKSDGKLHKRVTLNRKKEPTDSTMLIYKNGKLASVGYYDHNSYNSISYFYNEDKLPIKKEIRSDNENTTLKYNYKNDGLLESYEISKQKRPARSSLYTFDYNTDGRLIGLKIYEGSSRHNLLSPDNQYTLSYNKDGLLELIRDIGKNGVIRKTISYEVEIID